MTLLTNVKFRLKGSAMFTQGGGGTDGLRYLSLFLFPDIGLFSIHYCSVFTSGVRFSSGQEETWPSPEIRTVTSSSNGPCTEH